MALSVSSNAIMQHFNTRKAPQKWSELDKTAVRKIWKAKQAELTPRNPTGVPVNMQTPRQFQPKLASLGPGLSTLRVAQGKIRSNESKEFLGFICNLFATTHQLLRHMALGTSVVPPPFIVSMNVEEYKPETLPKRTESMVAAVHNKAKENRIG